MCRASTSVDLVSLAHLLHIIKFGVERQVRGGGASCRLSLPAKAAFLASRIAWSLRVSAENTKDSSDELLSRFKSNEDDQQVRSLLNAPHPSPPVCPGNLLL